MAAAISLWEAMSEIPDPRDASGKRHPLQAILTLSAVAILSGARSLYAIAQFGRDRGKEFSAALGFTRERTPCCTSFHYLFNELDREAFERAVRQWVRGRRQESGWKEISIDGKELRGTQGHEVPGVRVLAAYAHEAKLILDQIPVDAKTNEHKTALELLDLIPLKGTLVGGDAAFCQRDLSRKILKKGGLAVAGEGQPAGLAGRHRRRVRR
jgi:hypothetical protein